MSGVAPLHRVLLDTDVFSEVVKGKHAAIGRMASAYRVAFGTFTISAVTVTENVRGWQRKGAVAQLAKLIALFPKLDVRLLDVEAATWAGKIAGELERRGNTIGVADSMIAGIALANELPLVTRNVDHFDRVATLGFGLRVETWG